MRQSRNPQLKGNRVSSQLKRDDVFLALLGVNGKTLLTRVHIYRCEFMFCICKVKAWDFLLIIISNLDSDAKTWSSDEGTNGSHSLRITSGGQWDSEFSKDQETWNRFHLKFNGNVTEPRGVQEWTGKLSRCWIISAWIAEETIMKQQAFSSLKSSLWCPHYGQCGLHGRSKDPCSRSLNTS